MSDKSCQVLFICRGRWRGRKNCVFNFATSETMEANNRFHRVFFSCANHFERNRFFWRSDKFTPMTDLFTFELWHRRLQTISTHATFDFEFKWQVYRAQKNGKYFEIEIWRILTETLFRFTRWHGMLFSQMNGVCWFVLTIWMNIMTEFGGRAKKFLCIDKLTWDGIFPCVRRRRRNSQSEFERNTFKQTAKKMPHINDQLTNAN